MAAKLHRETFSNVDAAWLHMESPTNTAMITGVLMFDEPVDFERYRDTVKYRLLLHDRFRQRVHEPELNLGLPVWEDDPDFDLDRHIIRERLPDPGDQAVLQELVGSLMSTQLDFSVPLWQFHFVENFEGGVAIIARLHHCIADGLALMQLLLSLTDEGPDEPWPSPQPPQTGANGRATRWLGPVSGAYRLATKTWKLSKSLLSGGMQTLVQPGRVLDVARLGTAGTRALAKLLLIGPDQRTIFRGNCRGTKRAAWSQPVDLQEVKSIGQIMGCTLNDVLLAAVTGALRRYLEERQQPTEGVNIRAIVPVNLRPPDDQEQFGNKFGLVFLSLPVGIRDPLRRLRVLKRRMDAIKQSPEAVVAFGILNAIGMTPTQIEAVITRIFGIKGTAVMTNVPGPRKLLYLAGKPLRKMMFWVPAPANLGMGVSIFSYAGQVIVGVATDTCLVPDPDTIVAAFHTELDFLRNWGRPPRTARPETPPLEQSEDLETSRKRCQALTKSGRQCKNNAAPGSDTCWQHTNLNRT